MLVLAVAAPAEAPENGADYHSIVPSDWKLLPEDASSHERRFVSPSGDAWLTLYAQPADREPIQAHIAQVRRHENERITYEREEQTWISSLATMAIGSFTAKQCSPVVARCGIT
jgi:hypothetical protein